MASITLRSGMRSILKRKLAAHEYIKKAVEAGVYRTNEELMQCEKQRMDSADDLAVIMRRFRQDIVRGTSIHDYPDEYLILVSTTPRQSLAIDLTKLIRIFPRLF